MSDDVTPRYSLVMNTNYWRLIGGPFSCKPVAVTELCSTVFQAKLGQTNPAGARAAAPNPTPGAANGGAPQAGKGLGAARCTCSSRRRRPRGGPGPEGRVFPSRHNSAWSPPGRLPAPHLAPAPGGKDNTF